MFRYDIKKISQFREELMGVATLLVLLIHAFECRVDFGALNKVLSKSFIGVDIFLLLSGMSMWYSYHKENDSFYKKRMKKILPIYVPIIAIFAIWKFTANHGTILDYIKYVSTLSYWLKGTGAWYIALIILLYLITPSAIEVIERCNAFVGSVICIAGVTLVIYVCKFWLLGDASVYLESALGRSLSYFLGLSLGKQLYERKETTINLLLFYLIMAVIRYPLHQYTIFKYTSFALMGMILIPLTFVMEHCTFIHPLMRMFGKISLESYLFNCCLIEIGKFYGWIQSADGSNQDMIKYGIICLVGTLLSIGWYQIMHWSTVKTNKLIEIPKKVH